MPRTSVETPCRVECVSVLDASGNVDTELEPELEPGFLLKMHSTMLLSRRFDERMLSLQRQGRLGTFAPAKGQEGAQVGAVATLKSTDWLVPSYRETAALLWRGLSLEGLLLYNAGYNEGGYVPEARNDLPIAIPVGSQMLHAVGLAYGLRVQKRDAVALTFFGDGATSEGDFHEAMNFASVFDSPVVFVCQNNQYAISVPRARQTRSETLAQKAFAYGMAGLQVDGNDVLAVYVAIAEAVEAARRTSRPSLVECLTYRLSVHTTVDDPSKYRDSAEVRTWEARDPLPRFQRYLLRKGVIREPEIAEIERSFEDQIDAAVKAAEQRTADSSDLEMFEHLYASRPPYLESQRLQFLRGAHGPEERQRKGTDHG